MSDINDKPKEPKDSKTTEVKGSGIVTVYVNTFDEASAKSFCDEFKKAQDNDQKIIPVFIDSYGGYVDSLFVMLDVLLAYPGKVATIAVGKAMSCGAMLLACGEQGMRYAAPNSRIMIHHVSAATWGKVPEMEVDVKESVRLQKQVFHLVAKRCGQPADYFLKLLRDHGNTDLFLTPSEAKEHKVIDYIKYPRIKTEVFTKVTLG